MMELLRSFLLVAIATCIWLLVMIFLTFPAETLFFQTKVLAEQFLLGYHSVAALVVIIVDALMISMLLGNVFVRLSGTLLALIAIGILAICLSVISIAKAPNIIEGGAYYLFFIAIAGVGFVRASLFASALKPIQRFIPIV